jgi:Na+/melibiose symporter-like transporter
MDMADSATNGHDSKTSATVPNGEHVSDDEKAQREHDEHSKAEKGLDAAEEPGDQVPWTFKRIIAIAALCIVYIGSQILLYFVSAGLTYISLDLNTQFGNWMLTANTLAVAAICPFVGYLTDLIGRRWVCVFGTLCLIVGSIVMGTAHSLGAAIAAQAVGGIGAGICELTAITGVAEISPQRWRGVTLSLVTFSIIPFMPQDLYTVLIVQSSTWRWCFCVTIDLEAEQEEAKTDRTLTFV